MTTAGTQAGRRSLDAIPSCARLSGFLVLLLTGQRRLHLNTQMIAPVNFNSRFRSLSDTPFVCYAHVMLPGVSQPTSIKF